MNNNLEELTKNLKEDKFEEISPNYKKGALSTNEITEIINKIATELNISEKDAMGGTMLLMLKGAASGGTPQSLSVELKNGKTIAKRNISGAYMIVTGNNYLRRLAEGLAIHIGEFAEHFGLQGELAQRINTLLKAETGETLSAKEMAWCSSFSQNIPDLASRSSERLVKLLAEDYKKRFDTKKKTKETNSQNQKGKKSKKK